MYGLPNTCGSSVRNLLYVTRLASQIVRWLITWKSGKLNQHMKREEDQQDATIRCLLLTSVLTCFGHHYAHLQENKDLMLLHTVCCSGSAGCGW